MTRTFRYCVQVYCANSIEHFRKHDTGILKTHSVVESLFYFVHISLQLKVSSQRLPQFQALVENVTARLEPHLYLHNQGLYTALSLRLLSEELSQLEEDIGVVHNQLNNSQTQKLSKEVHKIMQ